MMLIFGIPMILLLFWDWILLQEWRWTVKPLNEPTNDEHCDIIPMWFVIRKVPKRNVGSRPIDLLKLMRLTKVCQGKVVGRIVVVVAIVVVAAAAAAAVAIQEDGHHPIVDRPDQHPGDPTIPTTTTTVVAAAAVVALVVKTLCHNTTMPITMQVVIRLVPFLPIWLPEPPGPRRGTEVAAGVT